MTPTEQQIVALLDKKQKNDKTLDPNAQGPAYFDAHFDWMIDAVELLLRHQIELREALRNNGILR